jgi:hypothetical protein
MRALETFISPKVESIIEEIGLEVGFIKEESISLYLLYWKEYVLKNLSEGNFTHLHLKGLGNIAPSLKRIINFKNSKHCTDEYKNVAAAMEVNASKNPKRWMALGSGRKSDAVDADKPKTD